MSVELETADQKMELQTPTDFEDLPVEMRKYLFSFFGRQELLRARLIGKAFDQVVRLTDFEPLNKTWWTLSDDMTRHLLRSNARHRHIEVKYLSPIHVPQSNVLKYAKSICIAGEVHRTNVSKIFKQLTSLEDLSMGTGSVGVLKAIIRYLNSNDNFKNLRGLYLFVGVTEAESKFMSDLAGREGEQRHFAHLKNLDFEWSIDVIRKTALAVWTPRTNKSIWRTYVSLYKLAWIHRETLTSIDWDLHTPNWFELRIRLNREEISPAERIEVQDLKTRMDDHWKVKNLSIKVLSWENMDDSWSLNNSFLKGQSTVIELSFKADTMLEPEIETLEVIGKKNKDSLKMVVISMASSTLRGGTLFRNLHPETLSQCRHLKTLHLKLPTLDQFLLSSLSPGLETLSVHYVFNHWVENVDPVLSRRIVTETLRHMQGRFPNLSKLDLHYCGVPLNPTFWDERDWSPMMQEFTSSLPAWRQIRVACSWTTGFGLLRDALIARSNH